MTDFDLLKLHLDALYLTDAGSRLVCVNDLAQQKAPRFYLGRSRGGNLWRFGACIETSLMTKLDRLCQREPVAQDLSVAPAFESEYLSLLNPTQPPYSGPAMQFPDLAPAIGTARLITESNSNLLNDFHTDWLPDVGSSMPLLALIKDDQAIAVCGSVRITTAVVEAGVETASKHRGHGYAVEVVRAWATAVRKSGARPIYSTSWQNQASRRVAEKLGLSIYGSDYHIQ